MLWASHSIHSSKKWKSEEACTLVVSLGLSAKSLICSACRKDVTRCLSNDEYTPRWEKDISINVTCFVRLCAVDTFTSLNKPAEVVFGAFQKGELQASTTQIPIPTLLCKHHYHMVYNIINPTQTHCVTCGMSLKHENPKPCPNPNKLKSTYDKTQALMVRYMMLTKYVTQATARSHLVILQESSSISKDSDLQLVIFQITCQTHNQNLWNR